MRDAIIVLENTHISDDSNITNWISDQDNLIVPKGVNAYVLDLDIDTNSSEHYDGGPHQFEHIDDENEFKDIELEDLVMSEGP